VDCRKYYVKSPTRIFRNPYILEGSTGDKAPCRISGRISKDGGLSWSDRIILQENIGTDNVKHPNFLRLSTGEILFTFSVRDIANKDVSLYIKRSKDECETWTKPQKISPEGGVYFTNADHILQHSSGRIILPCHWGEFYGKGDHYHAFCLYSDDEGKTWHKSKKWVDLPKRGAEEPGVIELKDGSLLSMMRTSLGEVYQSKSTDRGETWSEAKPTGLSSPSAANCIKRHPKSGELVFIWNNSKPYAMTNPSLESFHYPRNPLTAAISSDEGESWERFYTIENRKGYISAYPSLNFFGDNAIVTFYHASESASRDTDLRLKIFKQNWFQM